MTCPACDAQNRPGASHCKRCQATLAASCAGCGAPVEDGEDLCPACRTERVPAALGGDLDEIEELVANSILEEDEGPPEFDLEPDFVGRAVLLERLGGIALRAATERQLHFAALIGPSGIGKTRLAEELATHVTATVEHVRVLLGTCGGLGAPPFAVYARLFAARFGITAEEPAHSARARIMKGVGELLPPPRATEVAHFIAYLSGVPFPDSPIVEPLAEAPPQLEARLFIAVRRFLAADAEQTPLCLILDSVERASPETVNLTHYLAAGLEGYPVVLLAVGRPNLFDVHPSFGEGDVALERVEIGPLSPEESVQLLTELTRPIGLPPPALLKEHARSMAGTPRALFELVRFLLETGGIHLTHFHDDPVLRAGSEPAAWRFDESRLTATPLPRTLEELLAARLRAMEAGERDLLEKAAACGEAFWLDALIALVRSAALDDKGHGQAADGPSLGEVAAAGDRTRVEIAGALAILVKRGLVVESSHSSIPGEREYRFAYPPWWDVVYDRISADARRRYHRMIAQWLELRPEGRDEDQQEEIGRHLERAGEGAGAAIRYRRAAEGARLRYFHDKAIRLFLQSLQCVAPGDIASRIALWHDLGSVYETKGDHESALGAFERMLRLTWVVASRTKAAVALNKMGRVYRQKGDLSVALEYLERGLDLFQQMNDQRGIAGSLDDIGQVLWLLGRYDEALDRSAAGLEQRRRFGDKRSIAVSLLNIGNIERHRGLFDEANACYREALEIRRGLSDRGGVASSLNALGMLAFQRGDLDGARREWEEALGIAEEIGGLPLMAVLEGHLGELARALGNLGEARTRFERSEQVARELDDRRALSEATRNLGMIALYHGDNERALELCQRALEIAKTAGIPVNIGRAFLALGEVYASTLFTDDSGLGTPRAEEYFGRGVQVFRDIRNEAELALGLERFGKYWVERGEVDDGRKLLTEAQEIFSRLGMRAGDALQRMIIELG